MKSYLDLLDTIRREDWFPEYDKCDAVGNLPLPVELLVLGCLRYLGRGWTFDDLEESTGISEESHRLFFHKFVALCRKHLAPRYIQLPKTEDEIRDCMSEFTEAGSTSKFQMYYCNFSF